MLSGGIFFLCVSFIFAFGSLYTLFRREVGLFNLICISLSLLVSLVIVISENLFCIFLGFELLTILYSLIIASNGGIRASVLYSALNFTAGAAILALIPHDISNLSANLNFFYEHRLREQLFSSFIFLHAGAFFMAPIVISAYSSVRTTVLPFIAIFASKASLAVISKLPLGSSEALLVLSVLTSVYAIYRMSVEDSIANSLLAYGIGHVGLVGLMIYSGGEVLHYLSASIIHQLGFYIFFARLSLIGISKFFQLKEFKVSSGVFSILLFVSLLSNLGMPPTIGFTTKAMALHDTGKIFSGFISFLSYIFVLLVPVKFLQFIYCDKSVSRVEISTTYLEKFSIVLIVSCLLFPFSLKVYSVHKIFTQIALFVLALMTHGFVFTKLRDFFIYLTSWLKVLAGNLFALLRRLSRCLIHVDRFMKNIFCFDTFISFRDLLGVSLNFITFLFTCFIALFLVVGI